MRTHHAMTFCVASSLLLGACQSWHAAREAEPDGPRVVEVWRDQAAAGHFEISSGALVRRHEAQADLDAARDALAAGATPRAAHALRTAAAFFAGHAVRPDAGGRTALTAAAAVLGALADTLDRGGPVTVGEVVAASRLANLAEAEHHRVAAGAAWAHGQRSDTGDELVMAVDHLERALTDGGRPMAPEMRRILAVARADACTLMRDGDPGRTQVASSLVGLSTVIAAR